MSSCLVNGCTGEAVICTAHDEGRIEQLEKALTDVYLQCAPIHGIQPENRIMDLIEGVLGKERMRTARLGAGKEKIA
jgi:hypothetical protein